MIYLLIHDTLADKTLSFRFKPEIKLVRIIEIFQSKYKHLQEKDLVLSINGHLLDQEWTIRKIMTDYGLTDKGKLDLSPRVDSTLQELDDLDFGDLDDLGNISDGNMTVTPQKELEIDRTTVPIPSSKMKKKKQEEPELAEPVILDRPRSFDAFDLPKEPVVPSRRLGKAVSDEFDPLADDAFSTVVPTAEDSDHDFAPPVLFSQENEVDLDLDSFSNLTPFNNPRQASSSDENTAMDEDDIFEPIVAKQSDFLEELNEELFATSDDENDGLSATQTPIPTSVAQIMGDRNSFSPSEKKPSSMNYDEFDPLADSKIDLEEEKFENFSEVDNVNPFLQDTSEGFPTLDPDDSASQDYSLPLLEEEQDPFAPPEEMPQLTPSEEEMSNVEQNNSFNTFNNESFEEGSLAEDVALEESESFENTESLELSEPLEPPENTESFENEEVSETPDFEPSPEALSLEAMDNGLMEDVVEKQAQDEPSSIPVTTVPPSPTKLVEPAHVPVLPTRVSEAPTLTGVRYKRKILARHFRKMQTLQNFPLSLVIEKEDLKIIELEQKNVSLTKSFSQNAPLLEAIPYFPGCLSVPDRVMLNVQPAHTDFKFWITPLAAGNLKDARIDFFYRNVYVQSVPLPTKVNRSRTTLFWGVLALLTPLIYPLLNNWGIDLAQMLPRWPAFQECMEQLGGPVMLGIACGVVFFCLALLSYFIQRPKENKPIQQFLDLQL